ncbi:hypothetical protein GCM10022254_08410 [Actinomadura meridiana]|uniref:Uncharacterized protein n=1 Tax=Actinomadura meridiana TaxID=559626 RepID=A0ABP8BU58_9ACTN
MPDVAGIVILACRKPRIRSDPAGRKARPHGLAGATPRVGGPDRAGRKARRGPKAPAGVGTRGPSVVRTAGKSRRSGGCQWNCPSSVEPFSAVVDESGLIAVLTRSK